MFEDTKTNLDIGILLLTVGLGGMFVYHGLPKVYGGREEWLKLGGAMAKLGIKVWPSLWGFLAAISELLGGVALLIGVAYEPALVVLVVTMVVAAIYHLRNGDGPIHASHPIEVGIAFAGMLVLGPGSYTLASLFDDATAIMLPVESETKP